MKHLGDKITNPISTDDYKQRLKKQLFIFGISAAVLIALVLLIVLVLVPKIGRLEKQAQEQEAQASSDEARMRETIELFEKDDYEALKRNATDDMIPFLTKETLQPAKEKLGSDWGKRVSLGDFSIGNATQNGKSYKVGEVIATYENVSVTYRITFDAEGKLAGIYIR